MNGQQNERSVETPRTTSQQSSGGGEERIKPEEIVSIYARGQNVPNARDLFAKLIQCRCINSAPLDRKDTDCGLVGLTQKGRSKGVTEDRRAKEKDPFCVCSVDFKIKGPPDGGRSLVCSVVQVIGGVKDRAGGSGNWCVIIPPLDRNGFQFDEKASVFFEGL